MKKITYTVPLQDLDGSEIDRVVTGYAIGEYLAVRHLLLDYSSLKRDRARCKEGGQWQLEHVPSGYKIARGYYRADLVRLARQVPDDSLERLAESDPSKLVDALRVYCKEWVSAVMEQRRSVA